MIKGGPGSTGFDLKALQRLRERDLRAEGIVVAEGRLLAERLLREEGFEPISVLCLPGIAPEFEALARGRCPVKAASEPEMSEIAGFPFHRGVLAAARRPAFTDAAEYLNRTKGRQGPRRIVVLPEAKDPENLGSVYRSGAALGFEAVLLGPDCADPLSRRALRVSMGAALSLRTIEVSRPEGLRPFLELGFRAVGAVLDSSATPVDEWTPPGRLILLFGNEYFGLSESWKAVCGEFVTLPMARGTDSLNLAVAAAIFMHEALRNSFV